ncbi:hypothetical protein PAJ34TS1_05640 [Paenibacillus azoreducens]|uniref:Uncharacterized protein n=1 Tax=Paenibacillus azoreducens TaxID=116718 RepID=A0A920CV83_9BACL|nr:hypothetical protein J34TS1_59090 [Paenibacillus azoreducens]
MQIAMSRFVRDDDEMDSIKQCLDCNGLVRLYIDPGGVMYRLQQFSSSIYCSLERLELSFANLDI